MMRTRDTTLFMNALRDRRVRAVEVKEDYVFDYAGLQSWVVMHPVEDDRAYLVNMIEKTCTCLDFLCTTNPDGFICKHIIACEDVWHKMLDSEGIKYNKRTGKPIVKMEWQFGHKY